MESDGNEQKEKGREEYIMSKSDKYTSMGCFRMTLSGLHDLD